MSGRFSEREQVIVYAYAEIWLHSFFGSDAIAGINADAPTFWFLSYCIGDGDNLTSWIYRNAVERWHVAAYPCCIGAVGVLLLCDWYRFWFRTCPRTLLSEKYNIEYHGGEKEIYESVCENLSFVHSSFLIMC